MKIYLDNGYVNMPGIMQLPVPFIFVIGGRGTGKTYGALKELREEGDKFIFLRRTQTQVETVSKPEFSPFKSYDQDSGTHTCTRPINKYISGVYDASLDDDDVAQPVGAPIGYMAALSTISNLRGFDASDVTIAIYDEFIPERHERPIKNEGAALLNAYETINRNRELKGHPPLKLVALSNANDLGNPIFIELNLVRRADRMREKGQEFWMDEKRGVAIIMLHDSPISRKKADTALYRLSKGTEFSAMSLENDFCEEHSRQRSIPIRELRPIVSVGEICIYRMKSERTLYCSTHISGSPTHYESGPTSLARFRHAYLWIWQDYLRNNIVFEEHLAEILLTKYFS